MAHANPLVDEAISKNAVNRKRKRIAGTTVDSTLKEQSPPKRPRWISATRNGPGFYDLCIREHIKITLEEEPLQEFNRRDRLTRKLVTPAAAIVPKNLLENLPLRRTKVSADLKRFARIGGTDLSDLRGFNLPRSKQGAEYTEGTNETGKISPYNDAFVDILRKRNIYPPNRTLRPSNYEELIALLDQSRSSLHPSNFTEQHFEGFLDAVENARNETTVMADVFTRIKGNTSYPFIMNKLCSNWAPLVTDEALVTPQPDFYDGLRLNSENILINEQFDKLIVPAHDEVPFLPNFFAEVKAPKGIADIATRQALYDGALGARGIYHIRSVTNDNELDGKACTFSATYASGMLQLFAHFVSQPHGPNTALNYHMTNLGAWSLIGKEFRAGVVAFRNLRHHAYKIRTELAEAAECRLRALKQPEQPEQLDRPQTASDSRPNDHNVVPEQTLSQAIPKMPVAPAAVGFQEATAAKAKRPRIHTRRRRENNPQTRASNKGRKANGNKKPSSTRKSARMSQKLAIGAGSQ